MIMKSIDVRGFSCPEPVIRSKAALKDLPQGETLSILVDTVTARENIIRAVGSKNCSIAIKDGSAEGSSAEKDSGEFEILITKKS